MREEYEVNPSGMLIHPRWLDKDGNTKTGRDFEVECIKVDLEQIAKRIMRICKTID